MAADLILLNLIHFVELLAWIVNLSLNRRKIISLALVDAGQESPLLMDQLPRGPFGLHQRRLIENETLFGHIPHYPETSTSKGNEG